MVYVTWKEKNVQLLTWVEIIEDKIIWQYLIYIFSICYEY